MARRVVVPTATGRLFDRCCHCGRCAALAEAMNEFGFDARAVGEMAGVGAARGDGPTPPRDGNGGVQTLNISDKILEELNQLLTAYYEEGQPEDARASTLDAIRDIFRQTMPEGGLVDINA